MTRKRQESDASSMETHIQARGSIREAPIPILAAHRIRLARAQKLISSGDLYNEVTIHGTTLAQTLKPKGHLRIVGNL